MIRVVKLAEAEDCMVVIKDSPIGCYRLRVDKNGACSWRRVPEGTYWRDEDKIRNWWISIGPGGTVAAVDWSSEDEAMIRANEKSAVW